MSRFWFKPKTYGYGATPTTWQGWLATLAFVVVIATLGVLLLPGAMSRSDPLSWWRVATWATAVTLVTIGFIRFARRRTDGEWRWRWGRQD